MPTSPSPSATPPPTAATILHTTARVGRHVVQARRDLAATHGLVEAVHDLLSPGEPSSPNPVLETLRAVLLALRHQQQSLDRMEARLGLIGPRADARRGS